MKLLVLAVITVLTGCSSARDYKQISDQNIYDGVSVIQVEDRKCALAQTDEKALAMWCWPSAAPVVETE